MNYYQSETKICIFPILPFQPEHPVVSAQAAVIAFLHLAESVFFAFVIQFL